MSEHHITGTFTHLPATSSATLEIRRDQPALLVSAGKQSGEADDGLETVVFEVVSGLSAGVTLGLLEDLMQVVHAAAVVNGEIPVYEETVEEFAQDAVVDLYEELRSP